MRFSRAFVAFIALLPLHWASGSVVVEFSAGAISQRTSALDSTPIPVEAKTIGLLLADTAGDGFANTDTAFANASISTAPGSVPSGDTLGGYMILRVFEAQDLGSMFFTDMFTLPEYAGNFQAGTALALVWFPTVQSTDGFPWNVGLDTLYGLHLTNSLVGNSTMAFLAPADGFEYVLDAGDTNNGGGTSPTQLTATRKTVASVPEPSSMLLLGLGAFLAARSLRRGKSA